MTKMTKKMAINDIVRNCYAMKFAEEDSAEITMYGLIVERQPTDGWTNKPIEGDFIVQKEFLNDLETVVNSGVKSITFRMNSVGGNADVAVLIHNRIRELARNGVATTCIIDGIAASGGSLIACSCDNVIVNPSSMFMVHKCWAAFWGAYNADELRDIASSLDATDKQQVAIYRRKCEKTDAVITHMMSKTTFLVGQEIIDEGFADEMTESTDNKLTIAASADKRFMFANGHRLPIPSGMELPDFISTVATSKEEPIKTKSADDTDTKPKEETIMATNLGELRTENPELATTVEQEIRSAVSADNEKAVSAAAAAERQRLAEIDEIASLFDSELVKEAKYGENACSASELALRAAKASAKQGKNFIGSMMDDNKASGANEVQESPAPNDAKTETTEDVKASAKAAVKAWKEIKEGK